ncbi:MULTISPECIES: hypothetical protein [Rhizobium]|uniref:hypothetical protein n=1 Tax=Rhizobium TaxID=379 RepID=UPI000B853522|nr:hypothetical protein [Rhizobium miluonense]
MIRFEKKPDPQPLPKDAETNSAEPVRDSTKKESKKTSTDAKHRRASETTDDDRLI